MIVVRLNSMRLARGGSKQSFGSFLGPLEAEIIGVLCESKSPLRVREVHAMMRSKAAVTSVAVLLDRLFDKGLVTRKALTGRGGTYYLYSPAGSKSELEKKVLATVADKLVAMFGATAVSYFNERFSNTK